MSQLNQKYKALIFDCDGTLVTNTVNALPSKNVTEAIERISKKIHVGIATSRPFFLAAPIIKHLKLSGPSIVAGGALIVDGKTLKVLKEEPIKREDMLAVIEVFKKYKVDYLVQDGTSKDEEMIRNLVPQKALEMGTFWLDYSIAEIVMDELSKIPGISAHKVVSWQKNFYGLTITDVAASKLHGILEVARILNIDTKEIIGVGDGYNDFPLLMACGLKVAMGNAVVDLKEIADYVAPSVEEDGVVDVINRFII